jgi:hypothetical protein
MSAIHVSEAPRNPCIQISLVLCSVHVCIETWLDLPWVDKKRDSWSGINFIDIITNKVGIATGYGLDNWGVGVQVLGGKNFHFSMSSRPALRTTQPPIQWVPGTLSPGVKRQGRKADHSPPTSAKVKKMWIYTSTPPYAFMAYCLIS